MSKPRIIDVLEELRNALAPVFQEKRETWDREGPAAMEAFAKTGAKLDYIGGNCPVQAEGEIDSQRFYFRARGDAWQFHVAPTKDLIFDDGAFCIEREYGEGFEAGWMPKHEAIRFIVQGIAEFRATTP